jgi:hypothetical protein
MARPHTRRDLDVNDYADRVIEFREWCEQHDRNFRDTLANLMDQAMTDPPTTTIEQIEAAERRRLEDIVANTGGSVPDLGDTEQIDTEIVMKKTPVVRTDTNEVFPSIAALCAALGVDDNKVYRAINHGTPVRLPDGTEVPIERTGDKDAGSTETSHAPAVSDLLTSSTRRGSRGARELTPRAGTLAASEEATPDRPAVEQPTSTVVESAPTTPAPVTVAPAVQAGRVRVRVFEVDADVTAVGEIAKAFASLIGGGR